MAVHKNPGDNVIVDVTLTNIGNVSYNFVVDAQAIGLIDFPDQNIAINPGEQKTISFTDLVPDSPGTYDVYAEVGDGVSVFDSKTKAGELVVENICVKTDNPSNLRYSTWLSMPRLFGSDPLYGQMMALGKESCFANGSITATDYIKLMDLGLFSIFWRAAGSPILQYQVVAVFPITDIAFGVHPDICVFYSWIPAPGADLTPC